ncbi:SLATT domain-containing protein [Wenzhouxiangella sp. EGI_FJ10305]|uniref:SLATT domain-containing protein n=1 Tax=Wenzhouxiangella sp. EGI_FJ10305 TaxID=3243768 RepID=UPI0035DA249A
MEQNSQAKQHLDLSLEDQIRECYGRVVYSHKAHEKCADILLARLSHIKVAQITLSALSTVGFVSILFGTAEIGAIVGGLVSATLLVLNGYTKDYDLGQIAQKHRQAAADLWLIRERYLSLLTDMHSSFCNEEKAREKRDELLEELHYLYSGAPSTNSKAYKKAQEALKKLEDMTFSDAEIDAFLPDSLKRC